MEPEPAGTGATLQVERDGQHDLREPLATGPALADVRRLRAELTDATGDPAARRAAWAAWYAVVDGPLAISALRRLAAIAKETDDVAAMLPWLDEAIERARVDPRLRDAYLDALLERAAAHLNQQAFARAAVDLRTIEGALTAEPSVFRARWRGLSALLARGQGAPDAALSACLEARALAVACRDVPIYVSATLLLVALHQEADRPVDAYDTLIRARESLRDLLGEPGAGLIQPALSAFEAQLGDGLDAVHAAWVAQRTPAS